MALECVHHLSVLPVPNFGRPIKGSSDDEVSEGVVKGHRIYYIFMLLQRQQLLSALGVPDFTCAIVRASNELVATLVECAVRQR